MHTNPYDTLRAALCLKSRTASTRVAKRFLLASLEGQMDLILRASFLEGAAGVRPGAWMKSPANFRQWAEIFPDLHPAWTSKQDSGAYRTLLKQARHQVGGDGDDLLQSLITGLALDGSVGKSGSYETGRVLVDAIKAGATPLYLAKHPHFISKYLLRAGMAYLDTEAKRQEILDEGGFQLSQPQENLTATEVLAAALSDPEDSLGKSLRVSWLKAWKVSPVIHSAMKTWLAGFVVGSPPRRTDIAKAVIRRKTDLKPGTPEYKKQLMHTQATVGSWMQKGWVLADHALRSSPDVQWKIDQRLRALGVDHNDEVSAEDIFEKASYARKYLQTMKRRMETR